MNYRRLFIVAVVLNLALALAAYWLWQSSRGARPAESTAVEHPPMEGFTQAGIVAVIPPPSLRERVIFAVSSTS